MGCNAADAHAKAEFITSERRGDRMSPLDRRSISLDKYTRIST
jgi:hypothetical protein